MSDLIHTALEDEMRAYFKEWCNQPQSNENVRPFSELPAEEQDRIINGMVRNAGKFLAVSYLSAFQAAAQAGQIEYDHDDPDADLIPDSAVAGT